MIYVHEYIQNFKKSGLDLDFNALFRNWINKLLIIGKSFSKLIAFSKDYAQ